MRSAASVRYILLSLIGFIVTAKMGSTDLFPEKFGMYFATMSPLASKIYADIEGIEDYIKAHGPPSITYSEKCNIVDKFLIYDHLSKNDANGKLNKRFSEYQKYQLHKSETSLNSILDDKDNGLMSEAELVQPVYYNDSTLDQDHESVLLTAVAPKKPEKYVYDDNNYWIDEHSGTYSSCPLTQAKACKLQHFLDSLPPPPQPMHKRHSDHPHKYRAPPIPTFKTVNENTRDDDHEEEEEEDSSYIIRPSRKTSMSGIEDDEGRYSKIDKMHSEKSKAKHSVAVPLFGGLFGDAPPTQKKSVNETECSNNEQDLPNQVKNTDLIAELQAKLKKGKSSATADGISPRSSAKLNKPKAPPPPPPGGVKPPGCAVKVTSDVKPEEKVRSKNKETSSKKAAKENVASSTTSSAQPSKKSPEREINDDFVVDVSSPCKIVTQKTGLDFLDNW